MKKQQTKINKPTASSPIAAAKNIAKKQPTRHVASVSLLDRLTIRLSHADRLMLTKYLSVLLHSGLAMDDALSIIADQSRRGPLKKIMAELLQGVRGGETLASGFGKFPQVFSSIYINLVGAGEASGTLQRNLDHLAEQIQKEHTLRQKVRGRLCIRR